MQCQMRLVIKDKENEELEYCGIRAKKNTSFNIK